MIVLITVAMLLLLGLVLIDYQNFNGGLGEESVVVVCEMNFRDHRENLRLPY
jgi:hypothetical protein